MKRLTTNLLMLCWEAQYATLCSGIELHLPNETE